MSHETSGQETARLAELDRYQILDTPEDRAFDDLTLIAATLAETPIALISLVDDKRQWFKSHHGLEARQTPRDQAFCAHAIGDPGRPFLVRDAQHDPRFARNPLVTGAPNIRFYLGLPLVTPNRHALGTLCVIDRVPRDLGEAQVNALAALSRQVVRQLELHRREACLLKTLGAETPRGVAAARFSTAPATAPAAVPRARTAAPVAASGGEPRGRSASPAHEAPLRLRGVLTCERFDQRLAEEVHRAQRYRSSLSLLRIDVDGMGDYNAEFGRAAGDLALQAVADALHCGRPVDVIGRYGGDAFAVVLPETAPDGAYMMAERMREAVARAATGYRPLTVSVGAATLLPGQSDPNALIDRADRALDAAKRAGRNRVFHAATIPFSNYLSASEA